MAETGAPRSGDDLRISEISDADVPELIALWEAAGLTRPWNDPRRDIAFARQSGNSVILVGRERDRIIACAMTGHDGHRGAVYFLGVSPDARGCGHGRRMMAATEDWLRSRGVWKVNLMVREDNAAITGFYDALGYAREPRLVFSRVIEPAEPGTPSLAR